MAVNLDELRALPMSEKLRLVELLWDELGASTEPIPLPDWVTTEAKKRLDEMLTDRSVGLTHEEAWQRIDLRNG